MATAMATATATTMAPAAVAAADSDSGMVLERREFGVRRYERTKFVFNINTQQLHQIIVIDDQSGKWRELNCKLVITPP